MRNVCLYTSVDIAVNRPVATSCTNDGVLACYGLIWITGPERLGPLTLSGGWFQLTDSTISSRLRSTGILYFLQPRVRQFLRRLHLAECLLRDLALVPVLIIEAFALGHKCLSWPAHNIGQAHPWWHMPPAPWLVSQIGVAKRTKSHIYSYTSLTKWMRTGLDYLSQSFLKPSKVYQI